MTTSAPKTSVNARLLELDGLRAISILLVLLGHLIPLGPKPWHLNHAAAVMGMSLFFSLSGFLITSTLISKPVVFDFLVRRLARILPLYLLYVTLIFVFWDHGGAKWISSALFTINYQTQFLDEYTFHLWSLCVEIHFYLAIALFVALFGRSAIWLVWPVCLIVTALRMGAGEFVSIRTHHRVDEILAGACVAILYARWGMINRLPIKFGWLGIAAAALWITGSLSSTGPIQYLRPYGAAAVLAATIWTAPAFVRSILSSKPARYIAEISYALYIIHPATAAGWMNEGSTTTRYLVKRPLSFALTFLLAHLSTFYWESIWRKWASSYLKKRG